MNQMEWTRQVSLKLPSEAIHSGDMSASMPNHLMILAWPTGNGDEVVTSFRYSPSYQLPIAYKGTAKLTQIFSKVNATHFTLVYKCERCLIFDDPTQSEFNTSTSAGEFIQGWGQALESAAHDNGQGVFKVVVSSATHTDYSKWAALATSVPTGTVPTTTPTAVPYSSVPVPTATSYDYIVIGGGAAGIPIADKLSETGKSVLLIEKGIASSARWGGRCVLGGGAAVNAGLWWKANPSDWDYNFPAGWKAKDMLPATNRVFSRIPGTDHPSLDGKLYVQSGFDTIRQGLDNAKWTSVTANNVPEKKNRTYAHTPYMSSHGERGGPMATYLVTAAGRKNFQMWLNTSVERITRIGGHAVSLDVSPANNGGRYGTVQLTPVTGRVILAAGTFGTTKILFRSGIGPKDQLDIVATSADAKVMSNSANWLNLPVGKSLNDHLNTDTVISHPNVSYYDWPAAWNTPIEKDKVDYLTKRIGPLTQAAPNIGPMMWEEIKGPDGIVRQFQWTSRVEGSGGFDNGNTMTLSLYLGRGSVSRGQTTINKGLNMVVSTLPYVAMALDSMKSALKTIPGLTWLAPTLNQTGADYLKTIPLTYSNVGARRSNHWMGTAKLGTDSGLTGGTSVVDTNTKIYGTDNMFVVDASIFPGMPSTNPSGLIVVAAERAAELIKALPALRAVNKGGQCGGAKYTGAMVCAKPFTCKVINKDLSKMGGKLSCRSSSYATLCEGRGIPYWVYICGVWGLDKALDGIPMGDKIIFEGGASSEIQVCRGYRNDGFGGLYLWVEVVWRGGRYAFRA
ncbi:putative Cellobiose dehydrogenase [Glarea lozoyensis 74030]|uniref:Putative Cellobiose dehydrogenase n=1 Tax=Glarea lozoyensis (strain ATCC 74030 / MF5533) TaxID=1104152 RepID=H0ERH5_GLAL7|nr:putative Cellobiose dehydrogenase [Glarea lozoyensis 74030]